MSMLGIRSTRRPKKRDKVGELYHDFFCSPSSHSADPITEREYRHRGSFEEPYESVPSHAPYPPPEASALPQVPQGQPADDSRNYYSRPPPPGYVPPPAALNGPPSNAPYPADYPPPPVAAPPPQPYGYPRPPGADPYASRPRSADDMVSPVQNVATPSPDQDHTRDGGFQEYIIKKNMAEREVRV